MDKEERELLIIYSTYSAQKIVQSKCQKGNNDSKRGFNTSLHSLHFYQFLKDNYCAKNFPTMFVFFFN